MTIFVSTHFMNEALRCDRISLMHAGTVLACDTPARLMAERDTDDLETAFIGFIADAEAARQKQAGTASAASDAKEKSREKVSANDRPDRLPCRNHGARRRDLASAWAGMLAYSRREAQEIERDPVRLLFAFLGSALMMLAFGFGITTDVENIRFAYAGSRSITRESSLSFGLRGLALLHSPHAGSDPGRAATEAQITRDRSCARGAAQFRPKRSESKRG